MRAIIYDGRTYLDADDVSERVGACVTGLQAREVFDVAYLLVADVVSVPPVADVAPVAECEAPIEEPAPEVEPEPEPEPEPAPVAAHLSPPEPVKPAKGKRAR